MKPVTMTSSLLFAQSKTLIGAPLLIFKLIVDSRSSTIGAPLSLVMASTCSRFVTRAAKTIKMSSLKSNSASTASPRFALPNRSPTSSPLRRFSVSRTPSELGCVQSLMPLHSAVADARMTSCLSSSTSCRALSQVLGLSGPR